MIQCVLCHCVQVVSPGNAPPGCSFCRPQFAAAAAGGLAQGGGGSVAPLLQLDGLWHPLLGQQSSGSVVPNNVVLAGHRPGAMLLTGKLKEQQHPPCYECTLRASPFSRNLFPRTCCDNTCTHASSSLSCFSGSMGVVWEGSGTVTSGY
jgi:hypothetical protein